MKTREMYNTKDRLNINM